MTPKSAASAASEVPDQKNTRKRKRERERMEKKKKYNLKRTLTNGLRIHRLHSGKETFKTL